jgi:hypothetical protein
LSASSIYQVPAEGPNSTWIAGPDEDDPRLKQARDGFATGQEEPSRKAANLCATINTVEAVEILLGVLNSTGHGR